MTDHNQREGFARLKQSLMEVRHRPNQALLYVLAGLVAFCSIAYELVYSEQLTVIFGGTVLRYSITIGLFLFSFGVGSFLYSQVDGGAATFFRVEVGLAFFGPVGLVYILIVNAFPQAPLLGSGLGLLLSHVPIIVVGLLSGLEVPLLSEMNEAIVDANSDGKDATSGSVSSFSKILGMDYIGSLCGTVVYALVLYPRLGLIPTAFVLGLLNLVAALAFGIRFGFGRDIRIRNILIGFCLLMLVVYGGAVVYNQQVETSLTNFYLDNQIEADWAPGAMDVSIVDHFTTAYQNVVLYDRTWTGPSNIGSMPSGTERCLRLDMAIQLCESWTRAYHSGLVDVPAALLWAPDRSDHTATAPNATHSATAIDDANRSPTTKPVAGAKNASGTGSTATSAAGSSRHSPLLSSLGNGSNVLLVGGGDWIASSHLCRYSASVDHVDLDGEFLNYTRTHQYYRQYYWNDSADCNKIHTMQGDGYTYLRKSQKKYDMIMLDLPGIRDEKLLRLYSKQFYQLISQDLKKDGVVVTWGYRRGRFPAHYKTYMNTVRAGGFDSYVAYDATTDRDHDGDQDHVQQYYIFAKNRSGAVGLGEGTDYVERHRQQYTGLHWMNVPWFNGVKVNSVFDPNYDIMVG